MKITLIRKALKKPLKKNIKAYNKAGIHSEIRYTSQTEYYKRVLEVNEAKQIIKI
ncbi:hypothetical protein [Alkaliphilus peptidifermentans]|uniref:Uncharacterized protein n=1 Tax=Alkaliphilus peptidifermentans DSM 18978 TaxID=1120976 RepID=A0A1G5HN25_9FIRM|nr:hypothetical protein [Alkaliphilus peptidifermentans]SCY64710.1 hypothetical protein SAMN03080606_02039 [Alkaliphilus peptidifermentans DSM 18978]